MVEANIRPRRNFSLVEHGWADCGEPVSVLVGESASLVGWIPVYQERDQLPEGHCKDAWPADPSIPLLLSSGNHQAPRRFSGPGDFSRHLATLDFRGAVSIDQPTLFLDESDRPSLLQFSALARVGSTAVRPGYFVPALRPLLVYSSGICTTGGDISTEPDRVTIRLFLRIKLGHLGSFVGWAVTGNWPPWATLMIEYSFEPHFNAAAISFSGTQIPSQTRYVNWEGESEHLIEGISGPAYDGFFETPGCQDALANRYRVWPARRMKRIAYSSWKRR